jgi:hypothetical protein
MSRKGEIDVNQVERGLVAAKRLDEWVKIWCGVVGDIGDNV